MAKVLACPSCGNKHPIDLLVGLDTFSCTGCGKTLAVPIQATDINVVKKVSSNSIAISTDQVEEKVDAVSEIESKQEIFERLDNDDNLVVVARSTIGSNLAAKPPSSATKVSETKKSIETIDPGLEHGSKPSDTPPDVDKPIIVGVSRESDDDKSQAVSKKAPITPSNRNTEPKTENKHHVSDMALPFMGQMISWAISIPVAFLIVVIIPRLFGYGFHASDFVGVITNQGLGKYTVVISLILLWSMVTVACVFGCNIILKKVFHARRLAV